MVPMWPNGEYPEASGEPGGQPFFTGLVPDGKYLTRGPRGATVEYLEVVGTVRLPAPFTGTVRLPDWTYLTGEPRGANGEYLEVGGEYIAPQTPLLHRTPYTTCPLAKTRKPKCTAVFVET